MKNIITCLNADGITDVISALGQFILQQTNQFKSSYALNSFI